MENGRFRYNRKFYNRHSYVTLKGTEMMLDQINKSLSLLIIIIVSHKDSSPKFHIKIKIITSVNYKLSINRFDVINNDKNIGLIHINND